MALPGLDSYRGMRMELPRHLLSTAHAVLIEQERDEFAAWADGRWSCAASSPTPH